MLQDAELDAAVAEGNSGEAQASLLRERESAFALAMGCALTATASGVPSDPGSVVAATLVILGAFVLSLGAGWAPLRRRLLGLLSPAISNRLPPVPVRP